MDNKEDIDSEFKKIINKTKRASIKELAYFVAGISFVLAFGFGIAAIWYSGDITLNLIQTSLLFVFVSSVAAKIASRIEG
jgi:hypothetical protein